MYACVLIRPDTCGPFSPASREWEKGGSRMTDSLCWASPHHVGLDSEGSSWWLIKASTHPTAVRENNFNGFCWLRFIHLVSSDLALPSMILLSMFKVSPRINQPVSRLDRPEHKKENSAASFGPLQMGWKNENVLPPFDTDYAAVAALRHVLPY